MEIDVQNSNKLSLIAYIVLLALHIGLVWILPYFPSQDGPSHVYNLVILHDLLNGGREWGNYFTYELHAVPNLGFNLIAYPLLNFLSPFAVEKSFITIYILLMGLSVPILLKSFGRYPFPFSFLVFPIIFNFAALKGFYSYVIAVPLFLLLFSLAWKIHRSTVVQKVVVFNLSAILLFYVHLLAFIFFTLSLLAITTATSNTIRRAFCSTLILLVQISPVILNLIFYLKSGSESFMPDFAYKLTLLRFNNLVGDLFLFSSVNLSPLQLIPAFFFVATIIVCGYYPAKELCRKWICHGDIDPAMKTLFILIFSMLCIYFFCHGAYFNQRIPWVVLLISLPVLRLPISPCFKKHNVVLIVTSVAFLAINARVMWKESTKVDTFLSGLHARLPQGAYVLTYKKDKIEWSRVDVLLHAASYYGIIGGCVDIGNYETGLYQFPIRFRQNLSILPHPKQIGYAPETIDWSKYSSIRYLLGWEVGVNDRQVLQKYFHLVFEKGDLSIWERILSEA